MQVKLNLAQQLTKMYVITKKGLGKSLINNDIKPIFFSLYR